jgi:hypothetical protein
MNRRLVACVAMLLFLFVVVLVFVSIDTAHWRAEVARVQTESRGPLRELQYDAFDIFSGGALTMAELFAGAGGGGTGRAPSSS